MTTRKNLKKLIRARMSKTGESYSTARMYVLANSGKRTGDAVNANADPPNDGANPNVSVAPEPSRLNAATDAANLSLLVQETANPANKSPPFEEPRGAANPPRPLPQTTDVNPSRPPSKTTDTNPSRSLHDLRQDLLQRANSALRVRQIMAMSESDLRLEELLSKASSARDVQEIMGAASRWKARESR